MITALVLWCWRVLHFDWLPPLFRWLVCVLFHPHSEMTFEMHDSLTKAFLPTYRQTFRCTWCGRTWEEPIEVDRIRVHRAAP